ncbi:hypothetical protein FSARC_423 [Fusarium sarcochroum]|uniref:C2H2-type domain-containing protein n=1 Tax=Fusarium sarcochroum TaxID=1208366 RepID=A0A8H4XFH9_9HYPO|nr:hypothetical protein FSARC_423 [Fusarium sarcochroum]
MNTDDEPVDPPSGSRSIDLTSRSSSAQSYVTSLNRTTPSSSHINRLDPPGSSKISSAVDNSTSSSSKSNSNMNSRRRSNTSVDSTELSHGSSQSGPSNAPMRPFTGAPSSEPHVKLTPITRKISKAKKGVPVHTCNQCPKTFSRAEHLRRHQLSHSPPDLSCPIPNCNKAFHRKDLLDRHLQRHEQDDKDAADPKYPPRQSSPKTPIMPPNTLQEPGLQMPQDFQDPQMGPMTTVNNNSTMVPPQWSTMASTPGPNQSYNVSHNMTDTPENNYYIIGPSQVSTTNDTYRQGLSSQPRNISEVSMIPIPEDGTPDLPWPDSSTLASSSSGSTFSTPPDNTRRSQFSVPATNGGWVNQTPAYQTTSSGSTSMETGSYPVSFAYDNTPPQMYTPVFGDMGLQLPGYSGSSPFSTADQIPTSTVRSMSPSLAVAQSETLVAVPSLPRSDGVFDFGCSSGPPDGGSLLSTEDLMPLSLPTAASEAIPSYLEVYWDKVHPKYPIVHKQTFEDTPEGETEHVQVLQCAMAALATQFIPDADDRMKGAQLHAYAWQKSKVVVSNQYASASRSSTRGGHQAWKSWVDTETQRRLLAACFLLDVHSSRYHERQHVSAGLDYSSPSTLPIFLTATTTQLWEAQDSQTWARLRTRKDPNTISNTNLGTLSASDIASAPAFDAAILLAACSLYLPQRQSLAHVHLVDDVVNFKTDRMPISRIFAGSAIASTYLALHHTPLYHLLSVSGQSWVFNKKVPEISVFTEHQNLLGKWCSSGTAAIATVFAARALKAFLRLQPSSNQAEGSKAETSRQQAIPWADISDYWGVIRHENGAHELEFGGQKIGDGMVQWGAHMLRSKGVEWMIGAYLG